MTDVADAGTETADDGSPSRLREVPPVPLDDALMLRERSRRYAQQAYTALQERLASTTITHSERDAELSTGMVLGALGPAPVRAARVFGACADHHAARRLARAASRSIGGAPIAVVQLSASSWGVVQAQLDATAERPRVDEVLAQPVRTNGQETTRVTDIVFGDVSMLVPASITVSPWLYLLD